MKGRWDEGEVGGAMLVTEFTCLHGVGYAHSHQVILWFWSIVESYTNEQKLRLLQVSAM